jgi:hypothetical protein
VPPFLSRGWFERAEELIVGRGSLSGISYRIQFDAGGERWFQVAADGKVTAWAPGDIDDPDQEIRMPVEIARRVYRAQVDGTEALEACQVTTPDGWTGPPTPLDIIDCPELLDMPFQPEADLLVQYHHSEGPFGHLSWWWRFVEGRSESAGFGLADDADVAAYLPFANLVALRLGELSIYEGIEGGRLDGDVGPLMLLAGLLEMPEMEAARRACGSRGIPMANLGLVSHQPDVLEGLATLARDTT